MPDKPVRKTDTSGGGLFAELSLRLRLILRLLADRRVSPLLKLLPLGSLVYLLVPDLLPGPVDDALVITLGTAVFLEMCPEEIVKEHWEALTAVIEGQWREVPKDESTGED